MMWKELIIVVLFGLVTGSFVGALTYRLSRGLGFVKGRSFCDSCKKGLPWFVNIPLISYFFLQGKSYCCHKKISIRYPLIELVTAFAFAVLYFIFNSNPPLFITYCLLFILTESIFIIDLEHQIIPDELTWTILLYAICYMIYGLVDSLYANLFAGFLSALLLLTIHLITRGRGMGLGDVKLAIGLGLWLGFYKSLIWMFASFLTGGLVASILLLLGRAKLKQKIAFGPFLIIGFWIALFFNT